MIIKEWTKEEIEQAITEGYIINDEIRGGLVSAPISRHIKYRFALSLGTLGKLNNIKIAPNVYMFHFKANILPGYGELLGYPIVIDNSIGGIIFEECE